MLEEVLNTLHNWFDVDRERGEFTISAGEISPGVNLLEGQYFRIVGSIFNDGLHQYPDDSLKDESFTGEIWALAIPQAVQDLSVEIEEWVKENPDSGYTSESFGGYSYNKATNQDGSPINWRGVFRSQLNPWRKLA